MRHNLKSLSSMLLGTVVILNLFMVTLLTYTLDASYKRKIAEVSTNVTNLALLMEHSVTGAAREISLVVQATQLYLDNELRSGVELQDAKINDLLNDREDWIGNIAELRITDAQGQLRFGADNHQQQLNYSGLEIFSNLQQNSDAGLLITPLVRSPFTQDWVQLFARRYNNADGSFAGIVAATVPASHFTGLISGLDLGPNGIALVRDLNKRLVARHPPLDAPPGQTGAIGDSQELTELMASGVQTGLSFSEGTADDIPRTGAYRRLPELPMIVVAGLGEDDYLTTWRHDLNKAIALGLLFFLVTSIGAWLLCLNAARDMLERKRVEEDLRIAARAFESQVGMLITDANLRILRCNEAFSRITGYSLQDIIGQRPNILQSGRHDKNFYAAMWHALNTQGSWQGEIWNKRKSGEIYPQLLSIGTVCNEKNETTHYVASLSDISARKANEEQMRTLAFYDSLTKLPNRRLFLERLDHAYAAAHRLRTFGALLVVDLDDFKTLNDTAGHAAGDLLLEQVAKRLVNCVPHNEAVARLGGDEFVILLDNLGMHEIEAARSAEQLGQDVLQALVRPYLLGQSEYRGSASVGIALFGASDSQVSAEVLRNAHLAMSQAKSAGSNSLCFFDTRMPAQVRERSDIDAGLRIALEQNQFVLRYQMQVDTHGEVVGAEALVRWEHPEQGLISPARFIPIAEENGLILPIGNWVLETACRQLAHWAQDPQRAHLALAVNVSANQLSQNDFVDKVRTTLELTGAPAEHLKLELTESALVHDIENIIAKMTELKRYGVCFALDDFGTGYSSLSYLARLPLDQLKIDQSFVQNMLLDGNSSEIAQMIILLAERMGLSVLAEGVETEEQLAALKECGCYHFQGYLFGRPLPIQEFEGALQLPG